MKYIGIKIIEAEKMNRLDFLKETKKYVSTEIVVQEALRKEEGFKVIYENGYTSWSPKEVFEKSYLKIENNKKLSQSIIENFISKKEVKTEYIFGKPTTIVNVMLINGFSVTESTSCVDPNDYEEFMGEKICMERIYNKIWELLGFTLSWGLKGI